MNGPVLSKYTSSRNVIHEGRPLAVILKEHDDALEGFTTVAKAIPSIPVQTGTPTWDGDTHEPEFAYFDSDTVTLSDINPDSGVKDGAFSATNAGDYWLYATPKPGFHWAIDGSSRTRKIPWIIKPAIVAGLVQDGEQLYTGQQLTANWKTHSLIITGGQTTGTNAGTYYVQAKPPANRAFEDGSTDPKSFPWTISKAAGSLSINKTSLSLNLSSATGYIAVTRAGNGAITATSDNTAVATVSVSGEQVAVTAKGAGSATITISVAAGTNHNAPSNKTCSVSVTMPAVTPPSGGRGAAELKGIIDAGLGSTYLHSGDMTELVPLNGTMGGTTFNNYKVRFRIMDMGEDGHPIFMLWENEAGVPICLVPTNYGSTYVEANATGICMNRKGQIGNTIDSTLDTNAKNYGPNKKGWSGSYCKNTLMAQFKNLLPTEWQNIIIPTTVWTDNVGNATNAASSITSTTDYCFLPDEYELFGTNTYGNQYCNQKQKQWAFPKAGNSLKAFRHDATTTAASWFERGPDRSATSSFCGVLTGGTANTFYAAYAYGLRPAFRI